ncbi:MAG: hypothetical protein WC435_01920 [Candidatus Paceibacterota bacterium]
MFSKSCIKLDSNQLSLVFLIQESISRVMGDSFSISGLEVFGPYFVSHEGSDFQNFYPKFPNLILEEKTIFQFSVSALESGECDFVISMSGLVIGSFIDDFFFVEEVLINNGTETHLVSFLEKSSCVSEPVSVH